MGGRVQGIIGRSKDFANSERGKWHAGVEAAIAVLLSYDQDT
jgi:hypothetical protein